MQPHNMPPEHKDYFEQNALKITPGARRVLFLEARERTAPGR